MIRRGLLLLEGRWTHAHELLQEADEGFVRYPFSAAAWLAYRQGDGPAAWRYIRTVLTDGPQTEPGNSAFAWTIGLMSTATHLCLDAGALQQASEWAAAHDRWLSWSGATALWPEQLLLRAELARATDNLDAAVGHASESLEAALHPERPLHVISAQRLLGELETQHGAWLSAREHLDNALSLATDCAAPFERALTLVALAELALARGEDVHALLAEARATCEPLEAWPTLERMTQLEVQRREH